MRANYNIREDRGYGISYTEFSGTFEECQKWMEENTIPNSYNPSIGYRMNKEGWYDLSCSNYGDGTSPWTYGIVPKNDSDD